MSDFEQQAAAMYVRHYPGGDWTKVPEPIKRTYRRAITESSNPQRCAKCGATAIRNGAHHTTTEGDEQ